MAQKPVIILFSAFWDPYVSGAERFAEQAVARLSDRYRFVVLTSRISRAASRREERGGLTILRLGVGARFDKFLYPLLAPFAAARIKGALAHAVMESYAGIASWLYGMMRPRVPRLLTLQSGDLDEKAARRPMFRWLWPRIHRSPDAVTAISRFLAKRAARLRGGDADITVVPNGVDLSALPHGIAPVPERIVCVARLSPEKGIEHLLRAFAEVLKTRTNASLVLVGDGALRGELETLAASLGIAPRVTFRGALPHQDALREIAAGSVFACPSLAEGLGIVFIEAQALGVPVIGTDVGGIPDVIEDGVTGLLVPPRDASALASALDRLLGDKALGSRLADEARRRIDRFSWQRIMTDLSAIYDRLMHERRILVATGIYPPAIGGPATYVRSIAPALAAAGWDVTILTYGDGRTEPAPPGVTLRVVSNGIPIVKHILYAWHAARLVRRADVLFLQDPVSAGFPAAVANLFFGRRTLIKIVGDYAWEQGQNRFGVTDMLDEFQTRRYGPAVETLRMIERWVARRADRVITPSGYLKEIVKQWGVDDGKITVIPNAVSVHGVQSPISNLQSHAIATAGRLLPWKGMRELVAALPSIRAKIPDATLTIIGDGPLRSVIEEDVRRLGLVGAVRLTGRLSHEESLRTIAASRVFVLYSGYEGFSHQLIEAMATGVPVVASTAGGNAEVLRDGQNALAVSYGDGPALATAVIRALTDADLSARLAAAARLTAMEYTTELMTASLATELDRLVPTADRLSRRQVGSPTDPKTFEVNASGPPTP